MEEVNQYYVPRLIDIKAGYKCEILECTEVSTEGKIIEGWKPWAIGTTHDDNSSFITYKDLIERGAIRTTYLTVEDIVILGWEDEGPIIVQEGITSDKLTNLRRFNKGKYLMIYDFNAKVVMIALNWGDLFSVAIQRFDCPSINELTYIISALNLNHL